MARTSSDDAEFSTWYAREYARVAASVVLATGLDDLAEEATAEAFARALADWKRVREMTAPAAWVHRVAVNQLRSALRRAAVERRWVAAQRLPVAAGPVPRDEALWQAVASLPRRQRAAIALRYVLDLPEADIAAALGVRRGTVAATLSAARRQLAILLTPSRREIER